MPKIYYPDNFKIEVVKHHKMHRNIDLTLEKYGIARSTLEVKMKKYFLCTVMDLFSRKILAYGISYSENTHLIKSTFEKAVKSRSPQFLISPGGLILSVWIHQ